MPGNENRLWNLFPITRSICPATANRSPAPAGDKTAAPKSQGKNASRKCFPDCFEGKPIQSGKFLHTASYGKRFLFLGRYEELKEAPPLPARRQKHNADGRNDLPLPFVFAVFSNRICPDSIAASSSSAFATSSLRACKPAFTLSVAVILHHFYIMHDILMIINEKFYILYKYFKQKRRCKISHQPFLHPKSGPFTYTACFQRTMSDNIRQSVREQPDKKCKE